MLTLRAFFDRLTLRNRFALLLLFPMCSMIFFSVKEVIEKSTILTQISEIAQQVDFSILVGDLVHELQIERGLTAGFLGSNGAKFSERLVQHRNSKTDISIEKLQVFAEQYGHLDAHTEFLDPMLYLKKLDTIRHQVDTQTISPNNAIDYYNRINARFIDTLGHQMSEKESLIHFALMRQNRITFLKAKEKAAIERAVVTNIVVKGRFLPETFRQFSTLVAEQQALLDEFRISASPEIILLLDNALKLPQIQKVEEMRASLFEVGQINRLNILLGRLYQNMSLRGVYHSVKNLIIRGAYYESDHNRPRPDMQEKYKKQFEINYNTIQAIIDEIFALTPQELGAEQRHDVQTVWSNIQQYKHNNDEIVKLQNQGEKINAIDENPTVKIDDNPADQAMRRLAGLGTSGNFNIEAEQWFASASARIQIFKEIEDILNRSILDQMRIQQEQAWQELLVNLSTTIFSLLASLALVFAVIHSFLRQLGGEPQRVVNLIEVIIQEKASSELLFKKDQEQSGLLGSMTQYIQKTNTLLCFRDQVQKAKHVDELSKKILGELISVLPAEAGAIYLLALNTNEFRLVSSVCLADHDSLMPSFVAGQGICGRCVEENRIILFPELPSGYMQIGSALGQSAPTAIIAVPINVGPKVLAVIELAFFKAITDKQLKLMEELRPIIGRGLDTLVRLHEIQNLLLESQKKSELIDYQAVSLQRQLEKSQQHEASQKELIREMNFLQLSLDEHAIVSSTDAHGKINYMNDLFCKISGYSREELMGKNHRKVKSDEHSPEFYKEMWGTISQGKVWHGEVKNFRKGGGYYWVNATIIPFMNEQGKPHKYVSVRTDITQQKDQELRLIESGRKMQEQQAELVIAKDQAQEANRTKSDFLANMSHEIRTPMNAVIGMSYLALQTELTEKQNNYLNTIQSSAKSLLGIINDILDFSKIEAGKMTMESVPFNLGDVLDNLFAMLGSKVEEKGLELLLSQPQDVPNHLIGDPTRLSQVLINLTTNAVKFTDKGAIFVGVNLQEIKEGQVQLRFEVQDSGIGLTEEQVGRLFQAFSQADTTTSRKYGGTGLGLSICKQLVEMMGGQIGVSSIPGTGSTFFFTVWLGFQASKQNERHALLDDDLRDMRVLVVDDGAQSQQIMAEILSSFSFAPQTVDSGEKAIEIIEKAASGQNANPFKLIMMDWKLLGIDGLQASKQIKESPVLDKPPAIILVTSASRDEVIKEQERIFIDGFLAKPINASQTLSAIMTVFGKEPKTGHRPSRKTDRLRDVEAINHLLGAKVLLAEDNPINQQVATELLESNGLIVTVVNNGLEAVEAVGQSDFDIVLMDIQMPEMDGFQATAEIRKDPFFKNLPILAMTAHAMAGDREKSLNAGMDDHITKPIDPDKLFEALIKWVPAKKRLPSDSVDPESALQQNVERPDQLPGIDMEAGLKRVGGNRALFAKLLKQFYTNYQHVIAKIKENLDQGLPEEVLRLAHTVKGIAGTLGANDLYLLVQAFETAVQEGRVAEYPSLLHRFEQGLHPVLHGISTLITAEAAIDAGVMVYEDANPIDRQSLQPLFQDLALLLEEGVPSSGDKLNKIKKLIGHSKHTSALEKIHAQIEDYDYEEALDSLSQLASTLHLTSSPA